MDWKSKTFLWSLWDREAWMNSSFVINWQSICCLPAIQYRVQQIKWALWQTPLVTRMFLGLWEICEAVDVPEQVHWHFSRFEVAHRIIHQNIQAKICTCICGKTARLCQTTIANIRQQLNRVQSLVKDQWLKK